MELTGLKTLHEENPLGIDTAPYFSWIMQSGDKNVLQTGYRVVVTDDKRETVWDSGMIGSAQSNFVDYQGPELRGRTRYTWTVTVRDNKGNEEGASAWFETAFMSADEWKAKWAISPFPCERKKNWGNQPPATMFRKGFALKGAVSSARLYATCHGIYRLTINGVRPDDREFSPDFTVYRKFLCYQTYDVTELLHPGLNALGMYVGDGWYCGAITTPAFGENHPHAVLFQLDVRYADGSEETICSDSSLKAAQGPVLFSDLFAGEKYDANAEVVGWDTAGFSGDGWLKAKRANSTKYSLGKLAAQIGPPVKPLLTLPAVKAYTSPKGERIVDFGQNLAGRVRMKVNAPKGTEITLDHFEAPDMDGNYFNNIFETKPGGPLCEQRVCYISNGEQTEFEPLFTYQGFRYVRVTGIDAVRAEDFQAVALSSDNKDAGAFECSDARLNRLYENTRWSQRSNMVSIPTDCPQREKAGWTGDAQVYAATAFLNEDMTGFFTRWLKSLACEQIRDGRAPVTVPHTWYYLIFKLLNGRYSGEKGLMDASGWSDAAVIIPYTMYLLTGNTAILRDQYESMKRWCGYIIKKSVKRGSKEIPAEIERYLWNTGYHFGEWMIPSVVTGGYGSNDELFKIMIETAKYTAPIFSWHSLSSMAKIAGLLGYEEDAACFGGMADKVRDAFVRGVIGKAGGMPVDFQGAYVLPLYFGLVPDEFKEHFAEKLVSMIRGNGNRLDTGFLATPFLLDSLCKIGREDMAYELLYQENAPSWLNQVKSGATTIWESWYCYGEDGNPLMMSMNHYAFGCVCDWIFRYIGGIERAGVGFKHIKIHPRPDPSLSFAKRSYMSEYGRIVCEWERKGGKFLLSIVIPCNTTATVILPDGKTHETGSGSYKFEC